MTSLLFSIAVACMLSATSLIVVVFRASPLSAPAQAIPAFFLSIFLTVTTLITLAAFCAWKFLPAHPWDEGKILGISVREGVFVGIGTIIVILFHLLQILNWWIALLIYLVFLLIELAFQQ